MEMIFYWNCIIIMYAPAESGRRKGFAALQFVHIYQWSVEANIIFTKIVYMALAMTQIANLLYIDIVMQ